MKKHIGVLTILLFFFASPASAQRVGWDGTWAGGWDQGNGVQLVFAGETLVAFNFRGDYEDIVRSAATPDGGRTFAWDKGEATLSRTADREASLAVREPGRAEISIPLKRESN
jgi:hypothetical protein